MNLIQELQEVVCGFADTLPFVKLLYPSEKCHKQSTMYSVVVGGTYDAHNALDDSKALHQLIRGIYNQNANASLLKQSFTLQSAIEHANWLLLKTKNMSSFSAVVNAKAPTAHMANKCGASGLTYHNLVTVFQRDGMNDISRLFAEKNEGKARVTTSKAIVDRLCQYISGPNEK